MLSQTPSQEKRSDPTGCRKHFFSHLLMPILLRLLCEKLACIHIISFSSVYNLKFHCHAKSLIHRRSVFNFVFIVHGQYSTFYEDCSFNALADPWGPQGMRPSHLLPPNGPFSFIFMQFWGKIGLIIAFLSAPLELAPPWKSWIRHCSVVHFIFVP